MINAKHIREVMREVNETPEMVEMEELYLLVLTNLEVQIFHRAKAGYHTLTLPLHAIDCLSYEHKERLWQILNNHGYMIGHELDTNGNLGKIGYTVIW